MSGTFGLTGAADVTLVLKRTRGTADGVLHATGRDVDESEHALEFVKSTRTWELLAGGIETTVGATRATIIRCLSLMQSAVTPKGIADGTGLSVSGWRRQRPR